MSFFVTATDTSAGKTWVASLLVRSLRRQGVDCVGMKPICCGGREDAETLWEAADGAIPLNSVNPVWLRTPAAPYTASLIENRPIDLDLVRETFASIRSQRKCVIVEGIGGWLVPITAGYSAADLAIEFALPVVLVVANRLGAINHALLTERAIRESGLPLAGVILNHLPGCEEETAATTTNRSILQELLRCPILEEIQAGQREAEIGEWAARVSAPRQL